MSRFFAYLGTLGLLFGGLYAISWFGIIPDHPALSPASEDPIVQLKNVRHYAKHHMVDRSLYHLESAINSIRDLEMDFDSVSVKQIEDAIDRLVTIYYEIEQDSLITEDMFQAFEYTLNSLALAELRLSKKYAEEDSTNYSRLALKYAYMHLKTAASYSTGMNLHQEVLVYHEIDSLMASRALPPEDLVVKIDHMVEEMDPLVH